MPWNRDDYYAAILLGTLISISLIVALYLMGIVPRIDQFFKFTP